ncbi:unnamed protein product [Closterium sp. NIES-54]
MSFLLAHHWVTWKHPLPTTGDAAADQSSSEGEDSAGDDDEPYALARLYSPKKRKQKLRRLDQCGKPKHDKKVPGINNEKRARAAGKGGRGGVEEREVAPDGNIGGEEGRSSKSVGEGLKTAQADKNSATAEGGVGLGGVVRVGASRGVKAEDGVKPRKRQRAGNGGRRKDSDADRSSSDDSSDEESGSSSGSEEVYEDEDEESEDEDEELEPESDSGEERKRKRASARRHHGGRGGRLEDKKRRRSNGGKGGSRRGHKRKARKERMGLSTALADEAPVDARNSTGVTKEDMGGHGSAGIREPGGDGIWSRGVGDPADHSTTQHGVRADSSLLKRSGAACNNTSRWEARVDGGRARVESRDKERNAAMDETAGVWANTVGGYGYTTSGTPDIVQQCEGELRGTKRKAGLTSPPSGQNGDTRKENCTNVTMQQLFAALQDAKREIAELKAGRGPSTSAQGFNHPVPPLMPMSSDPPSPAPGPGASSKIEGVPIARRHGMPTADSLKDKFKPRPFQPLSSWGADEVSGQPFANHRFYDAAYAAFHDYQVDGKLCLKAYHVAWTIMVIDYGLAKTKKSTMNLSNSHRKNSRWVASIREKVRRVVSEHFTRHNPVYSPEMKGFRWGEHGLFIHESGFEQYKPPQQVVRPTNQNV